MSSERSAGLFPGQGAHAPAMLDGIEATPLFTERYDLVCRALSVDVRQALAQQPVDFINRNEVSSLLTVLASAMAYDRWRQKEEPPDWLAGYSVGEWTALYAAGVVDFPTLVDVVKTRAALMNACTAETPGGMIGVVGLAEPVVADVIQGLQAEGYFVAISNDNCLGQVSLACAADALQPALAALEAREPRRVLALPVAGPWHSALLCAAEAPFADYLAQIPLSPPQIPVIDNVTGQLLPTTLPELRRQLVKQLSSPVRWRQGIETLAALGCRRFIELGYGNLLTKFGYFINRTCRHETFSR